MVLNSLYRITSDWPLARMVQHQIDEFARSNAWPISKSSISFIKRFSVAITAARKTVINCHRSASRTASEASVHIKLLSPTSGINRKTFNSPSSPRAIHHEPTRMTTNELVLFIIDRIPVICQVANNHNSTTRTTKQEATQGAMFCQRRAVCDLTSKSVPFALACWFVASGRRATFRQWDALLIIDGMPFVWFVKWTRNLINWKKSSLKIGKFLTTTCWCECDVDGPRAEGNCMTTQLTPLSCKYPPGERLFRLSTVGIAEPTRQCGNDKRSRVRLIYGLRRDGITPHNHPGILWPADD